MLAQTIASSVRFKSPEMLLMGLESIANPFPPSQYEAGVRDAHVLKRANLLTDPAVLWNDRGQGVLSQGRLSLTVPAAAHFH